MATDDNLIDKADMLIQRRRVFVAGGGTHPFSAPSARAETGDLPVLTEVVDVLSPPPPVEPAISQERVEALAKALLLERLPVRQQLVAESLGAWLDAELPQVVMRVVDGLTDQIIAQVTVEARASLLPRLQAVLEADPAVSDAEP
jgi:hypothetical protein